MRVLLAVSLLVLAGCVDSPEFRDEPEPVQAEPDTPPAPASMNVTAPEAPGNGTGGFRLSAEGEAGTWLVAYHPFPTRDTGVGFGYSIDVDASGETFWIPPSVTVMDGREGEYMLEEWGPFTPFEERFVHLDGLTTSRGGGMGIGHYLTLHGVFVAIASSGGWSLDVEVIWDDEGTVTEPGYVASGDGFEVLTGSDSTVPVPGGPADIISFEWPVQAGWNHLELLDWKIEPDGVRQYDVTFANGYNVAGTGTQTGYWTHVVGSASSGGWMDYAGAMFDDDGTVSGEVTYVQVAALMEPVLAHLPGIQLPTNMTGDGYWGSTWPFHDLPDPTGPPMWPMPYDDAVRPGLPARP